MVELRYRDNGLVRSAEVFSPFWIDWSQFDIVGEASDHAILRALIGSEHYAHDYLGPRDRISFQEAHGPYALKELSPSLFEPTDASTAKAALTEWLDSHTEPEWTLRSLGHALIKSLPETPHVFRLPDLRPAHMIELGWIVGGDDGFYEWVFIDVRRVKLTLVVAADD